MHIRIQRCTYGYKCSPAQVDPLFVLDLSEPTKPLVKGQLKIPVCVFVYVCASVYTYVRLVCVCVCLCV